MNGQGYLVSVTLMEMGLDPLYAQISTQNNILFGFFVHNF